MSKKTFSYLIYKKCIISNIICMNILFIFSAFFATFTMNQVLTAYGIAVILFLFLEFIIDPIISMSIFKKVDTILEKWENNKLNTSEKRTELLALIMKVPTKRAFLSFFLFLFGCSILSSLYYFVPQINLSLRINIVTFIANIFGCYNSSLETYRIVEKICSEYAKKIFNQGISKKIVMEKKIFGVSNLHRFIRFLIIPILGSSILFFSFVHLEYLFIQDAQVNPKTHISRMVFLSVATTFIYLSSAIKYYFDLKKSNDTMTSTITDIITNRDSNVLYTTTLNDEMQYNVFLINKTAEKFKELILRANKIGNGILYDTKELSSISQDFATHSMEQNEIIQDITVTAEKSKEVSMEIQNSMIDVYIGVEQTNEEVDKSLKTLEQSISQMEMVKTVNLQNTQDIISLSKLIDKIDEILVMIKDIADQTRIIAFNAELEAVSAKEEGKNFHIVASEIRRLAKNTLNSIQEIEGHIVNLQNASLFLIAASENETNYINDQSNITEDLKTHFIHIKDSAEETNRKSLEIKEIITQQTTSFDQIAQTLIQIGEGFKNFTDSTKTISDTAKEIESAASMLSNIRDVKKEF